jgi:DNA topoisomerase VI subunit B
MLGNKLYGSPQDIAKVSIKELFQNSFDAIKEAIEKGQLTKGKIAISSNSTTRTIRVVDNGPGMPTSVMGNQFLQIAGTVKGTARASGGLGVAKMLFLFENKQLDVVSLRDGVLSRMSTTGDDLKAALDDPERGPTITTTTDPVIVNSYIKDFFPDGHGTAVTVQIPETYVDESTGDVKDISFRTYELENATVLLDSPLFDDIEVTFDSGSGKPKTLPIGATFPIDEYTPFANVRFAWGVARIYVSKEKKDKSIDELY